MARKREGTFEVRADGWWARVTLDVDGKTRRPWMRLGTFDKEKAKRMVAKVLREAERGRIVSDLQAVAESPETLIEALRRWCGERETAGVAMARTELGYVEHHVAVHEDLASLPVVDVRRAHCVALLDRASKATGQKTGRVLSRETIAHLRRLLVRFFNHLEALEVVPSNPMRQVKVPAHVKTDKRPRTPLTDGEYQALLAAPVTFEPTKKTGKPSTPEIEFFEVKVMAFVARTLGGARAAECLRWTWDMIDRETFTTCQLARAKTGEVQALEFPEVLRPFVQGWWLASGRPDAGPVFPVSRGERKGEARGKSNLAGRFRRALLRADVTRHELHADTAHSKRTDFHTLRRDYVSGLARSGTNEQTAMALAHHADSQVHKRYNLAQIKAVPVAALPQISPGNLVPIVRCQDDSFQVPLASGENRSGIPGSNRRHPAWEAGTLPTELIPRTRRV